MRITQLTNFKVGDRVITISNIGRWSNLTATILELTSSISCMIDVDVHPYGVEDEPASFMYSELILMVPSLSAENWSIE